MSIERLRAAADRLSTSDSGRDRSVGKLMQAVAETHGHYPECSCAEYQAAAVVADDVLEDA